MEGKSSGSITVDRHGNFFGELDAIMPEEDDNGESARYGFCYRMSRARRVGLMKALM